MAGTRLPGIFGLDDLTGLLCLHGPVGKSGQLKIRLPAESARLAGLSVCMTSGAWAMFGCSEKTVELRWQWRAGRVPGKTVVVQVDKVQVDGGCLFGLPNSPSLADGFPDPMRLEGFVQEGGKDWGRVRLRYPRRGIPEVAVGDRLGLALVDEHVCIGVARSVAGKP